MSNLPQIFIGSSSEGLATARALEVHLQKHADITLWTNGAFRPGISYLQSLLDALDKFDFAILIITPDDLIETRDITYASPRDNVLFELGLFMGRIGPNRTFFLTESSDNIKLPSDLSGISKFEYRTRENLIAATSPAATLISYEIKTTGVRNNKKEPAPQDRTPRNSAEAFILETAQLFFIGSLDERINAAEKISALAMDVPLDRILLMATSIIPGERVASAVALAAHIQQNHDLATRQEIIEKISQGLRDPKSRVRYRFAQILFATESLAKHFQNWLRESIKNDPNEAVRNLAALAAVTHLQCINSDTRGY